MDPHDGQATDRDLVEAWRAGDRAAGEALFDRHYASVARFFHNKVTDDVRDDLVQETFAACVRQPGQFRGNASFRAYLLSIARRRLMDYLRRHARRRAQTGPIVALEESSIRDLGETPESSAALHEEQRLLLEGLRQIPLHYQIALELHYWEQMSPACVAEVLEIPLGTAKTRLRDGRRMLERRLAEIATSPERLASTLDDLERWARRTKTHVPAEV